MNFSLSLSRDGSLLAFLWIGFALIFTSRSNSILSYIKFGSGLLLIVIGLSFRPWLSLAFIPIFLAIIKNLGTNTYRLSASWKKYILSLLILIGPLLLDTSAKKLMNLQNSFPEQQVIIHDLASISCMSANKSTQNAAIAALRPISPDPSLSREQLCGQFYPQNWASVVFYSNPEKPAISIINATQGETYRLVRDSWLSVILSNPTEYMQIKMIQLSQLFLAGESAIPLFDQPRRFFSLPYELFKNLRLFSLLPGLLLFSFITFSCRDKETFVFSFSALSSYVTASLLIVVAFIGDNQRYISWLAIIISYTYLLRPSTRTNTINL
jgi:hypothetical protein